MQRKVQTNQDLIQTNKVPANNDMTDCLTDVGRVYSHQRALDISRTRTTKKPTERETKRKHFVGQARRL